MRKFLQQAGEDWTRELSFPCDRGAYVPPGMCFGGSESSSHQQAQQTAQQTQQSASETIPVNLQNPAFTGMAGQTASQIAAITNLLGGGAGAGGVNAQALSALGFSLDPNGITGFNPAAPGTTSNNPFVAPVTQPQQDTLANIAKAEAGNFAAFNPVLGQASDVLKNEMSPGFAAGLATSPETEAAINAAIQPTRAFFNANTAPGVVGSFAQAGQRQGGSSAFDMAFGNSLAQEQATEAATAGGIANQAYQTGLNISANAPAQYSSLNSNEINTLIQQLQAQALPQLTKQLGINNALSVFQQSVASIMQSLGLQVQGEQPQIGYASESASQGQGTSQGTSSGSSNSFGLNLGPLFP